MLHGLLSFYSLLTDKVESQLKGVSQLNLILASLVTFYTVRKITDAVRFINHTSAEQLETLTYNKLKTTPIVGDWIRNYLYKKTKPAIQSFHHEASEAQKHWPPEDLSLAGVSIPHLEKIFRPILRPMQQIVPGINKVSGNIYTIYNEEFIKFLGVLMSRAGLLNPLHTNTLPVMARMEANLIDICRKLFNAHPSVGGALTHGGTGSIFEVMKSYNFYARDVLRISKPRVIVPSTAHVAFDKAAKILDMELIKIAVDPKTQMVDVAKIERAINSDTILLVGSAPNFVSGIIDPIQQLGRIAKKYNIGLHVDSCLGGFLTAFIKNPKVTLGEVCDFRVPGVTSISADLHKYGATIKGISVLLLGSMNYKSLGVDLVFPLDEQMAQAYCSWPGGLYVTPTLDGSRSLIPVVTALATLMYFGKNYYTSTATRLIELKNNILDILKSQSSNADHLYNFITIMGDPKLSIIAFKSEHQWLNIHQVATFMNKQRGWDLNFLQKPNAFHICLTIAHLQAANTAQVFCQDLYDALVHCKNNPTEKATGMQAMYCSQSKIPALRGVIMADVAKAHPKIMSTKPLNSGYNPFYATKALSLSEEKKLKY